jgi:hypothetical protein
MSQNVGTSTSRNPKGRHGLYRDTFTFPFFKRAIGHEPVLVDIFQTSIYSSSDILMEKSQVVVSSP